MKGTIALASWNACSTCSRFDDETGTCGVDPQEVLDNLEMEDDLIICGCYAE